MVKPVRAAVAAAVQTTTRHGVKQTPVSLGQLSQTLQRQPATKPENASAGERGEAVGRAG